MPSRRIHSRVEGLEKHEEEIMPKYQDPILTMRIRCKKWEMQSKLHIDFEILNFLKTRKGNHGIILFLVF